jgi:two-component system CheB/CheR fusion protein
MDAEALFGLMRSQAKDHALILLDADGRVIGWMMGAPNIFGRTAEEMMGETLHRLFTPEDQAIRVVETELESARRAGSGEDDRWMVRGDGARFWASGFVDCLRTADGEIAGYSKVVRDRTDLRGQVEALRNRVELLAAEDRRKMVMFGTLAHELRNPLGAVSNAIHLIDFAYPNDQKLAYALQILKRQTKYVSSLVEDLLEVARAQTGKTVLQYSALEMSALLADVCETLESKMAEKAQRIDIIEPPAPIRFEGDAVRLKQVFLNLLQNASKFSSRGATIFVKATVEGDEVVVRIEDHGRGISPEVLPHVFDLLSQAESPDERRPDGMGLGLSIVKEYVELHGGTVQVRSEGVGKGSEFTVHVPLTRRGE